MMRSARTPDVVYDIAIIGAGLSGLMLMKALLENEATAGKRILVIDRSLEEYAPRTWCFWEKGESELEGLVEKQWLEAEFFEGGEHLRVGMAPYAYKMIDGRRFRKEMMELGRRSRHIRFLNGVVEELRPVVNHVLISTLEGNVREGVYAANLVFDSRLHPDKLKQHQGPALYQQFLGWFVRSDRPVFGEGVARLMDFRAERAGAVSFCYLLPLNSREALVEFTLFTAALAPREEFETALGAYFAEHFPDAAMEISSTEYGVIPMAELSAEPGVNRVIPIGTAGGCSKPSSGYTFSFVREHTAHIIGALNRGELPGDFNKYRPKRFGFYDRVLLRVLMEHPDKGGQIFFRLFKRNPIERVLDFLLNKSSFTREIAIFKSMPIGLFLKGALKEWR